MNKLVSWIGGRKVLLSIFVVIVSTVLLVVTSINAEDFKTIMTVVVIAFPAGNAIQKAVPLTDGSTIHDGQGRKFYFAMGIYVLISALTGFKILDSGIYSEITGWIVGMYITGNVLGKATSTIQLIKK